MIFNDVYYYLTTINILNDIYRYVTISNHIYRYLLLRGGEYYCLTQINSIQDIIFKTVRGKNYMCI